MRPILVSALFVAALSGLTAVSAIGVLLVFAGAAQADAIDGDWCQPNGRRMSIHGSDIVTPGGKHTRGEYSRHAFSYVVPAGEAGAGEAVSIILLSEYLAHAQQGSATAPVQVWNRCQPGVS